MTLSSAQLDPLGRASEGSSYDRKGHHVVTVQARGLTPLGFCNRCQQLVTNCICCAFCEGFGNIWTGWHPTPVQCGHCHGTGVKSRETTGRDT